MGFSVSGKVAIVIGAIMGLGLIVTIIGHVKGVW